MKTVNCANCNKPIKRRERYLKHKSYCSIKCQSEGKKVKHKIECKYCKMSFESRKKKVKFCSRACSNKNRTGIKYIGEISKSSSLKKLELLRKNFNFDTCMVRGCNYSRTFDAHRLICGKDGGKYIIGNMYAICPNHHAELHRGLITFEKISDCELVAKDVISSLPLY